MGLLTLLRNAFGRSRKGRRDETESVTTEPERLPTQETARAEEPAAAPAEEPVAARPPAPKVPSPSTEPTPAPAPAAATAHVPDPRQESGDSRGEHDLVSAAFDNVSVPKPTKPTDEPPATADPSPDPTPAKAPAAAEEPTADPEPEPKAPAEPAKAEAEAKAEAKAETGTETEEPASADEPAPAEEPKAAEEPATVEEPEATPEEPKAATEAPKAASEEPKAKTEEPKAASEEPEAAEKTEAPEEPKASEEEPRPAEAPAAAEAPEPEPEPEAVAPESAPAPEAATPEAAPEPAPAATEPAAADAQEAPHGPSAPEAETATDGAGGETDEAEGEAEAAEKNPATPASHIRKAAPGLGTAYKAAEEALRTHGLTGARAKVHLVLDRSASMRPYYKDGSAQALGEQTLALAAHLDPEATVHVTFFSTELDGTGELTLAAHENKVDELHAGLGRMGRTSYHAAVEAVLAKHAEEAPGTPALVVFQTDGAPDAKTPATQALKDAAAEHPEVFFSFVAFGEHENKAFDYLRKLKTENTSFFHAGPTPRELTDKELYEGVLASWRP
ncbi:VWA domain-containing protein [Streptomyces sp. ME02-6978a]|uniref:VWA domain-containing protein n=1 Tax=unclassified Streptomyces TaxID=2593676 RepID=UPI0029AC6A6B|nr:MULTISPECIES: VWA domain-containing protein [unclassified Streptomyces]MDX3092771.1 VWA domain-containing protein [Streptomyces sp. ME12-02E]MDX3336055.1 VWA domain-containing protein [Streptomyces sp. ME02-6978a]